MRNIEYTTVDRILSKIYREIPEDEVNDNDIIEWIGEALDFLNVVRIQESAVHFATVTDYHIDMPEHLQYIIQIAKLNEGCSHCHEYHSNDYHNTGNLVQSSYGCNSCSSIYDEINEEFKDKYIAEQSDLPCGEEPCMKPFFNMSIDFKVWQASPYYVNNFVPVRLATHSFFNSIVCSDKDGNDIYKSCVDEYTIVGTTEKRIRFSFRDGLVAISYIRSKVDPDTGYPYIPDDSSVLSAIVYYIKWKLAEIHMWNGDRNFFGINDRMEQKWLKYVAQSKNKFKMPSGVDEYQNLLEGSRYLLPRDKYYGFFGNLNKQPTKLF